MTKSPTKVICSILILVSLILSFPSKVGAQDALLIIDNSDMPLIIKGQLNDTDHAFGGTVRITYTGEGTAELGFLASDLISGNNIINRSDINISNEVLLRSHQPVDVQINVNNIAFPGTYAGKITFMVIGQPGTISLNVEAHIGMTPNVISIKDVLSVYLVRCSGLLGSIDCRLASLLLPESAQHDEWAVQFENRTLVNSSIKEATAVISSDNNVILSDEIYLRDMVDIPPNDVGEAFLVFERNHIASGAYSGNIRFRIDGADNPVVIPIQVFVRSGPLMALIAILLGILMGRLARGLETPEVMAQHRMVVGDT